MLSPMQPSRLEGRYCAQIVFFYVMEDISMSTKGFLDQTITSQKCAKKQPTTFVPL